MLHAFTPSIADLRLFVLLSDPDDGKSCTRFIPRLQWRVFLDALIERYPGLADLTTRVYRDAGLANERLIDGSRTGDFVTPGLSHDGWLSMFIGGTPGYRADGHDRPIDDERGRRRAAIMLHGELYGPMQTCAACNKARELVHDAVTPPELRDLIHDFAFGRLDADYVANPCPNRPTGTNTSGARRLACVPDDAGRCCFCNATTLDRLLASITARRGKPERRCSRYVDAGDYCESYIVDGDCPTCEAIDARSRARDAARNTAEASR
jgi:hypothetical protein